MEQEVSHSLLFRLYGQDMVEQERQQCFDENAHQNANDDVQGDADVINLHQLFTVALTNGH